MLYDRAEPVKIMDKIKKNKGSAVADGVLRYLHLFNSGHQDFPEEEELSDIQLQAVLLSIWHAGAPL